MRLPIGYENRSGRLALNVKVYRGPTAEEIADVCADTGADLEGFQAYWNRLTGGSAELADFEEVAQGQALAAARERGSELWGLKFECHLDGRSGGWLVLWQAAPDADDGERIAIDSLRPQAPEESEDDYQAARESALEELEKLGAFLASCKAHLAAYPQAVAYAAAACGYLPEKDERETSELVNQAEARLAAAIGGLERSAAFAVEQGNAAALVTVGMALDEVKAARAALEGLTS